MTELGPPDDIEYIVVDPVQYKKYGWTRDKFDSRDRPFVVRYKNNAPRTFTLKDKSAPVLDQGTLGSCTANGIANALRYCELQEDIDEGKARSRLFIYYIERDKEGTTNTDSGASIRDGIKCVASIGACFEDTWPYNISLFTEKPSIEAYEEAKLHPAIQYERVEQTEQMLKQALNTGFPIVFGFNVFETIENEEVKKTGIIPLPRPGDSKLGGHCVLLTGYDDSKRLFQIQNSWGVSWGDGGFGYMSYDYITNPAFANDFWHITYVK